MASIEAVDMVPLALGERLDSIEAVALRRPWRRQPVVDGGEALGSIEAVALRQPIRRMRRISVRPQWSRWR